jgi:hypothetical protein
MNLNSVNLHRIRNYDHAKEVYESIVPYRSGEKKGARPLGSNRRYINCILARGEDYYAAVLYGYEVIKFYANGETHITLHYDSQSTRSFIYGASLFYTKVVNGVTHIISPSGKGYAVKSNKETLVFNTDHECGGRPKEYRYTLDRKKYAEARLQYLPFMEYVANMALVTERFTNDELMKLRDKNGNRALIHRIQIPNEVKNRYDIKIPTQDRLKETVSRWKRIGEEQDFDTMYLEFARVVVSSSPYSWYHSAYGYGDSEQRRTRVLGFVSECIKYVHADTIFNKEEVEEGKVINNENRKYFM